jgi:putative transposase
VLFNIQSAQLGDFEAIFSQMLNMLRISKGGLRAAFAKPWKPGAMLKELLIGGLHITESRLKSLRVDLVQPLIAGPFLKAREMSGELSHGEIFLVFGVDVFFEGEEFVVDKATGTTRAINQQPLSLVREKAILVREDSHEREGLDESCLIHDNISLMHLMSRFRMLTKHNNRSHHHAYHDLNYHLVLVTKYRKKVINAEILERMKEIFTEQCEAWGVAVVEFNGEPDHIHLLMHAHPSLDLSKLIGSLKNVSSRLIRKEFASHVAKFYWKPVFWTRAYCLLTTGGAPLEILKRYIQNQEEIEE